MNFKKILGVLIIVGVVAWIWHETQATKDAQYTDATFTIEGEEMSLSDERLQYFGNELYTDLDGDGSEDIAFIVTYQPGGSGTFYYAVASVQAEDGYAGSDGYFLGDRIAPQSTDMSPNPRHVRVVVFNYADRLPEEPMSTNPSVGKSVYLKLVPETMQWGIVEPDFEGESR